MLFLKLIGICVRSERKKHSPEQGSALVLMTGVFVVIHAAVLLSDSFPVMGPTK
jgi:hypothetical protein